MARIFQHEIDHLNGVLFTDLAARLWKFQQEEEHEL
jgi:peptide deformylase